MVLPIIHTLVLVVACPILRLDIRLHGTIIRLAARIFSASRKLDVDVAIAVPVHGAEFVRVRNVQELDGTVDCGVGADVSALGDDIAAAAPVVAIDPGVDFGRVVGKSIERLDQIRWREGDWTLGYLLHYCDHDIGTRGSIERTYLGVLIKLWHRRSDCAERAHDGGTDLEHGRHIGDF